MSAAKRHPTALHVVPAPAEEPEKRFSLKVYLSEEEKAAFEEEARTHSPKSSGRRADASGYARFILNARKDPLLFLHLCRLRDPTFAAGLMGNPQEASRIVELEKKLLTADHEADTLRRDRDDLVRKLDEAEKRLSEATDKARDLAARVVSLARVQTENRERAMQRGAGYEATDRKFLAISEALSITRRLTRKDLETRLVEAGIPQAEAAEAILAASRLELIVKGADGRFTLAQEASE